MLMQLTVNITLMAYLQNGGRSLLSESVVYCSFSQLLFYDGELKGHSQLVHMRIRYHFIANLHITETR